MPLDITATLGVPGSASTWVFNVVRELRLLHAGGRTVESFYSDAVSRAWPVFRQHRDMDRIVVWKLHEPDEGWRGFLDENPISLILSVRDPRDAMLSLMERFGETADGALHRVRLAFDRVQESLDHPHIVLRYEDRFFDDPATIGTIAQHLGIGVEGTDRARIFAAYATDAVRQFGQTLDSLPGGRSKRLGSTHYDELTHIHHTHIGDQRVGKWRDRFDSATRRRLAVDLAATLVRFGYDHE